MTIRSLITTELMATKLDELDFDDEIDQSFVERISDRIIERLDAEGYRVLTEVQANAVLDLIKPTPEYIHAHAKLNGLISGDEIIAALTKFTDDCD